MNNVAYHHQICLALIWIQVLILTFYEQWHSHSSFTSKPEDLKKTDLLDEIKFLRSDRIGHLKKLLDACKSRRKLTC